LGKNKNPLQDTEIEYVEEYVEEDDLFGNLKKELRMQDFFKQRASERKKAKTSEESSLVKRKRRTQDLEEWAFAQDFDEALRKDHERRAQKAKEKARQEGDQTKRKRDAKDAEEDARRHFLNELFRRD